MDKDIKKNASSESAPESDDKKEEITVISKVEIDGEKCDLDLILCKSIIKTHKAMLRMRSPVFRAMFIASDSGSTLDLTHDRDEIAGVPCSVEAWSVFIQCLHKSDAFLSIVTAKTVLGVAAIAFKYEVTDILNSAEHFMKNHLKYNSEYALLACARLNLQSAQKHFLERLVSASPADALRAISRMQAYHSKFPGDFWRSMVIQMSVGWLPRAMAGNFNDKYYCVCGSKHTGYNSTGCYSACCSKLFPEK